MSLIASSELLKAYERYEKAEAAKANPAPAAGFKYIPRSKAQWRARSNQTRELPLPVEAPPVIPAVEAIENAPAPKTKLSAKSLCTCGHRRNLHCTGDPKLHTPEGSASYWCTTEHCADGSKWNGSEMQPCDCMAFRVSETDAPKLKHKKADDFTPCANPNCSHPRVHHCKVRRPSKAKKPKMREWEGFADQHGVPHLCKHAPADTTRNWRCTSTSCAEVSADEKTFCSCERYVNPLARPRAKAAKSGKI